jgi:RimJ/RimL family protein N-acetyltransferase
VVVAVGRYHLRMASTAETAPAQTVPVPERPIIRGELVWLRAFEPSDVTDRPIEDADLAHFAGFRRSFSRAEAERFVQKLASMGEDNLNFSICALGSSEPIGACGLREIDRRNGSAEVSIFIADRKEWGKGLGTDAMRALLDFAFGEMRMERIWLRVFDYNPRAVRSYEKAGYVTEVVLRHDRFHRGAHHDTYLMAITRPDWERDDRKRSWDY